MRDGSIFVFALGRCLARSFPLGNDLLWSPAASSFSLGGEQRLVLTGCLRHRMILVRMNAVRAPRFLPQV
jgi:hypothetical protein